MKRIVISFLLVLCVNNSFWAQQKVHPELIKTEDLDYGYEHMRFIFINKDTNRATSEKLGVSYYYRSEGGYVGLMTMWVSFISSKPDKNGRYSIIYSEIKRDKSECVPRACSVKAEFGKYLLNFARSSKNNYALFEDNKGFINSFSKGNIPWIEDEVTLLYHEHFNKYYDVPRAVNKH